MDRKTVVFYFTLAFIALDITGYLYFKDVIGPVKFANREVRFSALVHDTTSDGSGSQELARLTCGKRGCADKDLKDLFEREYKRLSGKQTTFVFTFRQGPKEGIFTRPPQDGALNVASLLLGLRKEFADSQLPFIRTEARLIFRLVRKPRQDTSEASIGSAQLRLGLIEWRVGGTPQDYMWNLTKTAHEIGHIFGASDKFDAQGKTVMPAGLVEPARGNDQVYVEIMSGTRPTKDGPEAEATHINGLAFGQVSAKEMLWQRQ